MSRGPDSRPGLWSPSLGAWPTPDGVSFRVWAPRRRRVELVLEDPEGGGWRTIALDRDADGFWEARVPGLGEGALYRYRLDGKGPYPDPVSRRQPLGVHGPSGVVDPGRFDWRDEGWGGVALEELVVYELHVGAFTAEGTFSSAAEQLPYLRDLGVTAVELMPVADFPGRRNWGYDGVCLFAPARCYGTPDELRRLVDRAHRAGLAVLLDVVYNHLGPDGAYLGLYSPDYFSASRPTPWGKAVNLDGHGSEHVRAFLVENALHWVHEYHLDGLRLDACHALFDDSPRHFLAELPARVRDSVAGRRVVVIAEDSRNAVHMVRPESDGGWGLDAVWADDLHHQVRVALAGDRDGYYRDFTGSLADVARTLRDGWFYQGQRSERAGGPRGSDPTPAPPRRFVVCVQNHDQVGNRALGERLHHQVGAPSWRAASALLVLAPETPLLFMGQEWAAASPFLFFTDHSEALGHLVTAGRRREFAGFAAFSDEAARERIPDPQAEATFQRSRLDWAEAGEPAPARVRELYRALLRLRRELGLGRLERGGYDVRVAGSALVLDATPPGGERVLLIVRLGGNVAGGDGADAEVEAAEVRCPVPSGAAWRVRLSTEDPAFVEEPMTPEVTVEGADPHVVLRRPGAVVLTS